ncbi:MAG: hypothetical protein JSW20_05570 [Nitrospiraceae bacterium]|nr:MAG: hypothetical protein JSW20_05570 [Nitrospiraceae bacterium]
MKKILIIILICAIPGWCTAETVKFNKSDAISLMVTSYVHGFKEFGTSVIALDDSVSVGIYYDLKTQKKQKAEMLAKRFREKIPIILSKYPWGKNIQVYIAVYEYDRMSSGY